jgi:predicted dehydrogenase
MTTIRLGYVGCGMMAQRVHLPNFASLPDCRLMALAEVRRDLGEKVQRRYGIPKLYLDHRAMLEDTDLDAIAVSAAFATQGEVAREALAAGKHVFMEKPMAISLAQGEAIVSAGKASGARLMVGYMKRYDAGNELVHATVAGWRASGELGRVVFARAHGFGGDWTAGIDLPPVETSSDPMPPAPTEEHLPAWLPSERARGYVSYLQQYTHNINLLRFVLDAGHRVAVKHADFDPDGYAGVVVLDVDGVRATLETGSLRYYRWDEHTQVYFERGWVHTWAPPLLLRNAVAEVEIYRGDDKSTPGALGAAGVQHTVTRAIPEPRWSWAYKREAAHFIESLRSGEPFRSPGEDALTDVRLFEDIYRNWLQI